MKQGDIWLINLDPTIGAEIKKTRPVVIVNDNSLGKLPLKVIIPLTINRLERQLWNCAMDGENKTGWTE